MLTDREIAAILWLTIFVCLLVTYRKTRSYIIQIVRLAITPKFSFVFVGASIYLVLVVWGFWRINLWNTNLLKDTVLWVVIAGFGLISSSVTERAKDDWFRRLLLNALGASLIVDFLLSSYTFPLIVEFLLVPAVVFITALGAVAARTANAGCVKRATDVVLVLIGLLIFLNTLVLAISDWNNLISIHSLQVIFLPALLSFAFAPYLLLILLFAEYENLFIRLQFGRNKSKDIVRYTKLKIFKTFGLKYAGLRKFGRGEGKRLFAVQTRGDVDNLFNTTSS